jgi:protein O-mannosyl-transferase
MLAAAGLIAVVAALAYLPALNGGFVFDDNLLLTDNALIKAPDGLRRFWFTSEAVDYWPVPNTTLWLEWRLWGMQPTGYHITNLLLHIITSWLIWLILRRLVIPGAFLAALLFSVHPVNVESVAWIAQRKGLLALLFFQLSVLAFLKSEDQPDGASRLTRCWYWLSLAAFALAMLSKVSVAVAPLLLLAIVWWRRPLARRDLLRIIPFCAVAAVLVRVNLWFHTQAIDVPVQTATMAERLLGAGGVPWFYLSKALLPVDLVFTYPDWQIRTDQPQWWLPLLAAAALTGMLWRYRCGWGRPVLFAWGWFCVALVPVMGFTDIGSNKHLLVADHYQHLALIAVLALVAAGWSRSQEDCRAPHCRAPRCMPRRVPSLPGSRC